MPCSASIATSHWGHSSADDQNLQDFVVHDQHQVMLAQSRIGVKGLNNFHSFSAHLKINSLFSSANLSARFCLFVLFLADT